MSSTAPSPNHTRIDRAEYQRLAPAAYAAMLALGKSVADSGLETTLAELVKIRASQINGCAFCTLYHTDLARRAGVSQRQLDLLPAWRDANGFSPRQRAALAWAEALTAATTETDAAYAELGTHFTATEIAFLTTAIANINAWNRIAGGLCFTPPAA